jgi:hypothetical protein
MKNEQIINTGKKIFNVIKKPARLMLNCANLTKTTYKIENGMIPIPIGTTACMVGTVDYSQSEKMFGH